MIFLLCDHRCCTEHYRLTVDVVDRALPNGFAVQIDHDLQRTSAASGCQILIQLVPKWFERYDTLRSGFASYMKCSRVSHDSTGFVCLYAQMRNRAFKKVGYLPTGRSYRKVRIRYVREVYLDIEESFDLVNDPFDLVFGRIDWCYDFILYPTECISHRLDHAFDPADSFLDLVDLVLYSRLDRVPDYCYLFLYTVEDCYQLGFELYSFGFYD